MKFLKGLNVVIVTLILVGLLIIFIIANSDLTSSESALLSILLTIISIVASFALADHSKKISINEVKNEYKDNLRTYALNAAEKVGNLSKELRKLSDYLSSEVIEESIDKNFRVLLRKERTKSSIHIVNTLMSINDTYISDWRGIIGDELDLIEEKNRRKYNTLLEATKKSQDLLEGRKSYSQADIDIKLKEMGEQLNKLTSNKKDESLLEEILGVSKYYSPRESANKLAVSGVIDDESDKEWSDLEYGLSRIELVKILLHSSVTIDLHEKSLGVFTDLIDSKDIIYAETAVMLGLVSHSGNRKFYPTKFATKEESLNALFKVFGIKVVNGSYKDTISKYRLTDTDLGDMSDIAIKKWFYPIVLKAIDTNI